MNRKNASSTKSVVKAAMPARRWLPLLTIMAAIYLFSEQPGGTLPLPDYVGSDKVAHAIAYGTLAASCLYAAHPYNWAKKRFITGAGVTLFCLLYGLSDEFHQSFVPGRDASLNDVAADLFGATLTALLWHLQYKKTANSQKAKAPC